MRKKRYQSKDTAYLKENQSSKHITETARSHSKTGLAGDQNRTRLTMQIAREITLAAYLKTKRLDPRDRRFRNDSVRLDPSLEASSGDAMRGRLCFI
jgi:hypothetical protein